MSDMPSNVSRLPVGHKDRHEDPADDPINRAAAIADVFVQMFTDDTPAVDWAMRCLAIMQRDFLIQARKEAGQSDPADFLVRD